MAMTFARHAIVTALTIVAVGGGSIVHAADDAQKSATPVPPASAQTAPASANPAPASPPTATPPAAAPSSTAAGITTGPETGLAAVYSDRLNGHKTASGARYDRNRLTAAHKTLPFGTKVKITNNKNHKSVTVTINDRGPTQAGRILDISPRAAQALGIRRNAMAEVTLDVIGESSKGAKK